MAQVRIEVEGHLSRGLGSGESGERWEREIRFSPGERVCDVLARLAREEPAFCEAIFDGQDLRPSVLVLLNGKLQNWASAAGTLLEDGYRLTFYPMVAGG